MAQLQAWAVSIRTVGLDRYRFYLHVKVWGLGFAEATRKRTKQFLNYSKTAQQHAYSP
ncbi:hypothetical protein [Paraburkholderia sp. GAS42]|uniref:hypothetical protein n=1 Tax=Paraburkholderia sp. GAS42 TaxID=3035135 RepID=UPI003D1DA8F9